DADLLTDPERRRVDAGVELLQPRNARARLAGDRRERVSALDGVRPPPVPVVDVPRCRRGDGRGRGRAVMLPLLEPGSDEEGGDRARREEGGRGDEAREASAPQRTPAATVRSSSANRAASAAAASRQSPPAVSYAYRIGREIETSPPAGCSANAGATSAGRAP